MFVLLELFAQQGKSSAGLFHLGLQGQYIVRRSLTEANPLSGEVQLFVLGAEDGLRGLDLPSEPGLGDGGGNDVRRQGQPRTFQFVAPILGAGGQCFQCAPVATGQVELVMHADTGVVQTEFPRIAGLPQGAGIQALALGADTGINLRIKCRSRLR